jgi:hypothetical protein
MSYLKYSNLCASMLRNALKEPLKESAKAREIVYFKNVSYKNGKADTQGTVLATECATQLRPGGP